MPSRTCAKIILAGLTAVLSGCAHPTLAAPGPMVSESPCGPGRVCLVAAREAYREEDYEEAIRLIQAALDSGAPSEREGRLRFLLARSQRGLGSEEALENYREGISKLPILEDYGLLELGKAHLERGRSLAAALSFEALVTRYPDSLLAAEARMQVVRAYAAVGHLDRVIEHADHFLRRSPEMDADGEVLFQSARAHLMRGDASSAAERFQQVVWEYDDRLVAGAAQVELDQLRASGVVPSVPGFEVNLDRVGRMKEEGRLREAAQILEALLSDSTPSHGQVASMRFELGFVYAGLGRREAARAQFEELLELRPPHPRVSEVYIWLMRDAFLQGDLQAQKGAYARFKREMPGNDDLPRALWYLIRYQEDAGEDKGAQEACRELIANFPYHRLSPQAHWRLGWIEYKAGRYDEAYRTFQEFQDRFPNAVLTPRVWYWAGRALEKMGHSEEARPVYAHLCRQYARTYYCRMALEPGGYPGGPETGHDSLVSSRRVEPAGLPQTAGVSFQPVPESDPRWTEAPARVAQDLGFLKAKELAWMGMWQESGRELQAAASRFPDERDALLFLADRLYAVGAVAEGLKILRLNFREVLNNGNPEMPESFWYQAYPVANLDPVAEPGLLPGSDPFLIAAVIREESSFDFNAVSKAGAIGLMQLMPQTAERAARQLQFLEFEPEMLRDPRLNVRLGTWYMSRLLRRFEGNIVFAVAAYNAGPEAVSRWIRKRPGLPPDEFIEEIPYPETRGYLKRVLRSYYEYRAIYAPPAPPIS